MRDDQIKWQKIQDFISAQFGSKADLNKLLLLIGIREAGLSGSQYSKEEKVKLMHIATCRILSPGGYYKWIGIDEEGWPDWEKVQDLPYLDMFEQETFIRQHIIEYFESEEIIQF